MTELGPSSRSLQTAALTSEQQRTIRELLDLAFDGDFSDADWSHALGGMHVLAWEGEVLVGHAAVVERHLATGTKTLRVGYVEALAVHPDWRRRGIGDRMMERVEQVIPATYDLGALAATDHSLHLYERRGWVEWRGPLSTQTPAGAVATPQETVHVLLGDVAVDLDAGLMCDWRDGDAW
jgi:aminoglycoside 2'-N-acetyltransferase I